MLSIAMCACHGRDLRVLIHSRGGSAEKKPEKAGVQRHCSAGQVEWLLSQVAHDEAVRCFRPRRWVRPS